MIIFFHLKFATFEIDVSLCSIASIKDKRKKNLENIATMSWWCKYYLRYWSFFFLLQHHVDYKNICWITAKRLRPRFCVSLRTLSSMAADNVVLHDLKHHQLEIWSPWRWTSDILTIDNLPLLCVRLIMSKRSSVKMSSRQIRQPWMPRDCACCLVKTAL